jgi:pyruvate kinase
MKMLHAGMSIARLTFLHGEFSWHATAIANPRGAAVRCGKRAAIMADVPSQKTTI